MLGWKELSEEEKSKLGLIYKDGRIMKSLVRYENGFLIPRIFPEKLWDRIQNFEVREDDIWVVTYPKCGTRWTQVCKIQYLAKKNLTNKAYLIQCSLKTLQSSYLLASS